MDQPTLSTPSRHRPENDAPGARDTMARVLVLGAVYAAATIFAVAYSPAMTAGPQGETGRVVATR